MDKITVYTFANEGGPFGSFSTQDADEAKTYGEHNGLRVIANEFTFEDSEVAWDFLDNPTRLSILTGALRAQNHSLDEVAANCDFSVGDLPNLDSIVMVEVGHDGELWVTTHSTPEDVASYRDSDVCEGWDVVVIVNVDTGVEYLTDTTTTVRKIGD